MHWRKPFPPRSLRPSPFAELIDLLLTSFRPHEPATLAADKADDAAALPQPQTAE